MATYTAPTTRTTGALISASIWNTDIVENLKYFKDAPVFDGDISVGDDILLTSTGAVINFASGDVTVTHSTNTLTFAGAASGYIFNDGNVGIGVTPSAWDSTRRVLQIGGSGSLWTNTSGMGFLFLSNNAYYDGTNYKYLNTDEASYYAQTTAGEHSFATAVSGTAGNNISFGEKFRILNGGNIAIAAAAKFYLDGVAGTGDTWIDENAANNLRFVTGGVTALQMDSAQNLIMKAAGKLYLDGGVDTYITESAANTIDVIAGGAGGVRLNSGATSWVAISDERAKTDLVPMTDALAKIASLRAVTGRYHTDEASKRRSFLIAQDVQMVLPEAVTVDHNGMLNLSYTDVIPLMVAAMQQQQQKIAALEARIH